MNNNKTSYFPSFYQHHSQSKYLVTQCKKPQISTLFYRMKKERSPEYKIKEVKGFYNFKMALVEEKKKLQRKKENEKMLKQITKLCNQLDACDDIHFETPGLNTKELTDKDAPKSYIFPTSIKIKKSSSEASFSLNNIAKAKIPIIRAIEVILKDTLQPKVSSHL